MFKYKKHSPRWITFENKTGAKGMAGSENNGAKGHAWEHIFENEEKVLCDYSGQGVVRRIWITLSNRTPEFLRGVIIRMYWDNASVPQVCAPIGDFFCMSTGKIKSFENKFFTTAEGRSFCSYIPMPFFEHCKITLTNESGKYINNLFYDIDISLEELCEDDMLFYTRFCEISDNELGVDAQILPKTVGKGRFLGASIGVFPNSDRYGKLWWGEGEVKIYLDGDNRLPTICGTGAEDYIGSAWELGEFCNMRSGCTDKSDSAVSMYRFHTDDEIFFEKDIMVTIQTIGGGMADAVKEAIKNGAEIELTTFDDGDVHHIKGKSFDPDDLCGYVCFYRRDRWRMTAYYYLKK